MLEHLFGSRTRVKLLSLFLRHPDEPVFVREITRRIGTQINAVRREVANLAAFGILAEAEVDEPKEHGKRPGLKRKYYRVNKQFPLLLEVTSLVIKAQVLLEKSLDKDLLKIGDVRYLALLGLFMGKTGGPVDVFIVGDLDKSSVKKLMSEMEKDLGQEVNYALITPDEYRYRKDMGDKFLLSLMDAQKNVLIDRLNERKLD